MNQPSKPFDIITIGSLSGNAQDALGDILQKARENSAAVALLPVVEALRTLPPDARFHFSESSGESQDNRNEISYQIELPKGSDLRLAWVAFENMGFKIDALRKEDYLREGKNSLTDNPAIDFHSPDDGGIDREIMDNLNIIFGQYEDITCTPKEFAGIVSRALPNKEDPVIPAEEGDTFNIQNWEKETPLLENYLRSAFAHKDHHVRIFYHEEEVAGFQKENAWIATSLPSAYDIVGAAKTLGLGDSAGLHFEVILGPCFRIRLSTKSGDEVYQGLSLNTAKNICQENLKGEDLTQAKAFLKNPPENEEFESKDNTLTISLWN